MPFERHRRSGAIAPLLAGEHRPGAPEPGHDLVGDEEHVVAVAELARAPQEERVVHAHAARALHHRLEDHGRDRLPLLLQKLRQCRRGLDGAVFALELLGCPCGTRETR